MIHESVVFEKEGRADVMRGTYLYHRFARGRESLDLAPDGSSVDVEQSLHPRNRT
jgi:hypothetical protein